MVIRNKERQITLDPLQKEIKIEVFRKASTREPIPKSRVREGKLSGIFI